MTTTSEPIHIISLGAGVQSSTMALMAAHGEITPMPRAAIFADTMAEPASVYRWLDWLEKQLPFPVLRVTNKMGLENEVTSVRKRKDSSGLYNPSGIPHYVLNRDGSKGHSMRQCTYDFKITPIMREIRRLLTSCDAKSCVQWIGISADEAQRMKPSRVRYAVNRWPLIELEMKRRDCLAWMESHGFPKPPRSACVFCPYHSDHEWSRLRNEEPAEFKRAVEFERKYQISKSKTQSRGIPFLHNSCVPLSQVDFSTDIERGQLEIAFGNECDGMCGV